MTVRILHGDMLAVLPTLEAGSVHAVVTDPPYHLTSIVKRFGSATAAPCKVGATGAYSRASKGFMGQTWDGGDIAMRPETWAAVLRVMKPGAHLVAFGGSRTYHRMACAIEDAGFEIRDTLSWIYGSGFPKSHDVSKGIDKAAGAVREVVGPRVRLGDKAAYGDKPHMASIKTSGMTGADDITAPATPEAAAWQGWGTALKPAHEPIILARRPLDGTVAGNTLKHGVGGLNIDACRIETDEADRAIMDSRSGAGNSTDGWGHIGNRAEGEKFKSHALGRWPANVCTDGSDEVMAAFAAYGERSTSKPRDGRGTRPGGFGNVGHSKGTSVPNGACFGDTGTAARFFFSAKADAEDRAGSKHPTIKPMSLMNWLVKLITPPGGTVLDPFAGSGTTLLAADRLQFNAIGIEQSAEYVADIQRRMLSDAPLFAEIA